MALGTSTFALQSGGGSAAPGAQSLSRQVVLLGVSPGGTVNTLYKPQSDKAILDTFKAGSLCDALLELLDAEGAPPPMAMPMNPANVGGKSAVSHTGPGTGTIAVTLAPHIPFIAKVVTAGIIGTAALRLSYDGGTTYGDTITTSDTSGGSFIYRIPGTYCTATFAAGTYVLNSTSPSPAARSTPTT